MSETKLSEHLAAALAALDRAREAARLDGVQHREVVQHEITSAESSVARARHLIEGPACRS